MNSRQFYETVKQMRAAQKAYFRTRSYADLNASKRFEKAIDAEIQRVEAKLEGRHPVQLVLFDDNPTNL